MSESNQRWNNDYNYSNQDNPDDIDRENAQDDGRDHGRSAGDEMNRRGMMVDSDIRHQAGTDLHDGSEYDQQHGARYEPRMGSGDDMQEGARSSGHRMEGSAFDADDTPRNSGTGETDARTMQRRSHTQSATHVGDEGFSDAVTPESGSGAIRVDYEGDYSLADTEQTQADHFREERSVQGQAGDSGSAVRTQADYFQEERQAQSQDGGYLGMTNTSNDWTVNERTVAAIFHDWDKATRAVDALQDAGFDDGQIGIARLDDKKGSVRQVSASGEQKEVGENVAGGIATGAAVGGVTGLLAALASLAIPGVGPIVAGGVLATTFGTAAGTAIASAGVGAGIGAAAGGLIGALTSLGLSEEEARAYESDMRSGSTLVTVRAEKQLASEAIRILQQAGGESRSSTGGSGDNPDPNWRFG